MKKLKMIILTFLVFISLILPMFVVEATEPSEGTYTEEVTETDADYSAGTGTDADAESETGTGANTDIGIEEDAETEENPGTETGSDVKTDDDSEKAANPDGDAVQVGVEGVGGSASAAMQFEGPGTNPVDEPTGGPHGSGSAQLNSVADDYRFYTEYYVSAASGKSISTAGVVRRTTIKVYAKAGEVILFGSSVSNSEIDETNTWKKKVTGKDIVITTPTGEKICEDVLAPGEKDKENGQGYIKNPKQEKNGPLVNHTEEAAATGDYYTPLRYDVTKDGVYTFEFHSIRGYNDGTVPVPKKAGDENWNQGTTSVAAWDVTVLGTKKDEPTKWEVKDGRAWADYLALTTGKAGTTVSDLNVHVLSHDGYVYKVNFKKAVPFGFIFFANNTGFMTSVSDKDTETHMPIYHSFYDASNNLDGMKDKENITLHMPNEIDTDTEETYKIFFNAPNEELDNVTDDKGETIMTNPGADVELTNLLFTGIGNNPNLARAGMGGHFTFDSNGEAMVTIRLDLRKAILESEQTMDSYNGSGIVEITAPAHKGANNFYWDGKDTDGIVIPAGIYGNMNVVLATEIKRGELHFPVIDMEGLNGDEHGGLMVERLNGTGKELESRYNLYYNNNPLVSGTIEGGNYPRNTQSGYDILSDGTKSFRISSEYGGPTFFPDVQNRITTLVKDDKEYLAQKMFGESYSKLSEDRKSIIDAEYGKEQDTFHFEPVDSKEVSMQFSCSDNSGGGNQAGIDAWTYYTQGVHSDVISFAIMDTAESGLVRGEIFYDADVNSKCEIKSDGDYSLSNIKVRLIDEKGQPLVHEELLPCFDDAGHFIYNKDGSIKHELKSVTYETLTDVSGKYRFTGVPYSSDKDTTYYVQVMLTDVQSEVLRYTCTTSKEVKEEYIATTNPPGAFLKYAIDVGCGADGNKIEQAGETSDKVYGHKYSRDTKTNETIFDLDAEKGQVNVKNTQKVTFSSDPSRFKMEGVVRVEEFGKIGYSSTVPTANQRDYKVTKKWGTDSQGNATHQISDGVIVELWVWNDANVKEDNPLELSRRTGALMDTQVLNDGNGWSYTWKGLDDRLQYYILEYYTKKKPNGEIIYNDKHEPRKVLIGGTMPIFSEVSDDVKIYGFKTNLGDYPETIPDPEYPDDPTRRRIPIQKFSENNGAATETDKKVHANSITHQEKLESVDNNARQYDVTYTLGIEGTTNVINITNSQVYDDRTYYVWLNHERELPEFIGHTYVDDGERKSHALTLEKDGDVPIKDDEYRIKGISVSSVDAAAGNSEGNATDVFRIKVNDQADKHSVWFTANSEGNYKTGTGTRTYQVKYVVDKSTKKPVSVKVIKTGDVEKLVTSEGEEEVENSTKYIVYSWFMTIHVYDVVSDGVFEYDPNGGAIRLQAALPAGKELKWELKHDEENPNKVTYASDDSRTSGILQNDIFRLPLYKNAVHPDMGTCADLVGIAYAGAKPVDDISGLKFSDTYESRYGTSSKSANPDGTAIAQGSGGYVKAKLNTTRITRINRTQDHANYADVSFVPGKQPSAHDDVFYYKIVVFAEDNTYQYNKYSEIDASMGVEMYTYFTMKPKWVAPTNNSSNGTDDEHASGASGPKIIVLQPTDVPASGLNVGGKSPKTGDNSHVALWICITILGAACVAIGIYKRNKR